MEQRGDLVAATNASTLRDPPRKVWNSLEITKLIMSSATPIAVFTMGFVLQQQAAEANRVREAHAQQEATERQHAADAQQLATRRQDEERAQLQRLADQRRDDALRAAAKDDAERLRREAIARDDALRRESYAHDLAARAQTVELARYSRIIDKRADLWQRIAPLNEQIFQELLARKMSVSPFFPHDQRLDVVPILQSSEAAFAAERPYFSKAFAIRLGSFYRDVADLNLKASIDEAQWVAFSRAHEELLQVAADELALRPGSLVPSTNALAID